MINDAKSKQKEKIKRTRLKRKENKTTGDVWKKS